jgi:long-subunit fatty acid transport protein
MSPRSLREVMCPSRAVCRLGLAVALLAWPVAAAAQGVLDTDRIDITGRQNLTLGSGARAMGMGGAFLARADDATAASWNPAGLSYLRLPEVSLVGGWSSYAVERPAAGTGRDYSLLSDRFAGTAVDFGALTWPLAIREVRGAIQLSYQRAISFDGTRRIRELNPTSLQLDRTDDARSDGGFDVIALGTGFRLTRSLRAGITVNRWLNGYTQSVTRNVFKDTKRPLREFDLRFRPSGWSFNFGLIWSPIEPLNVAAVYKTPFTASVQLDKTRRDTWVLPDTAPEVTTNSYSSRDVRLDFPSSFGFGLSWRARETLTLSADFTQTRWSKARVRGYFGVDPTGPTSSDGKPATKPAPDVQPELQYPTIEPVPELGDTEAQRSSQKDKQEIRLGVEWVLIAGAFRIPLRAGYFSDRQIVPNASGGSPRFNGFTAGLGVGIRSVLLDVAYVYEYGEYFQTVEAAATGTTAVSAETATTTVRNALRTNRLYASIIYRFSGRP